MEADSNEVKEKDCSSYDPMSVRVRADPYPYYSYMRQNEPVKYLPGLNAYAISRNEDVRAVLLDHETFYASKNLYPALRFRPSRPR